MQKEQNTICGQLEISWQFKFFNKFLRFAKDRKELAKFILGII